MGSPAVSGFRSIDTSVRSPLSPRENSSKPGGKCCLFILLSILLVFGVGIAVVCYFKERTHKCQVSDWSSWSSCSQSSEKQTRFQSIKVWPQVKRIDCPPEGNLKEGRACVVTDYSPACQVLEWSLWSECNRAWRPGRRERQRKFEVLPGTNHTSCPPSRDVQGCEIPSQLLWISDPEMIAALIVSITVVVCVLVFVAVKLFLAGQLAKETDPPNIYSKMKEALIT
ncbi:uncharacterized protein LOC143451289 [Clavelina lepadiformis]|uniref:uncharacterized protein LOC143451289 n=1 Tax=Clavelina lepadiformis TaxID=159417 RepID=UPI004042C6F2